MGKNIRNRDTGQRLFSNLAGFFFVSIIILEIPFHVLLLYILYFNFISNITPLINKQHNIQVMTMSVFALAASS